MPVFHVVASGLSIMAVALPFLFAWTQPPLPNFWPLMATGGCLGVLGAVCLVWACGRRPPPLRLGVVLAWGILLAAVLGAAVGLLQFFGGDVGWGPWVYPSRLGEALGNLRQRNQQATLMGLGMWALLWLVEQLWRHLQGRQSPACAAAPGRAGRSWPVVLVGVLVPWALLLIAACAAATASRTGALEWAVILLMLLVWRRSTGGLTWGIAGIGVVAYAAAAWWLPDLLQHWSGVSMDSLFDRLGAGGPRCGTRSVLWPNVLFLIAQRPWAGWGWGELDYAHYITQFPGERFCVLVDNAHNLPLHLAVELGVPVALAFCGVVAWRVWRARPWAETEPLRQWAWGILALIGVHSLLEFPLWYGPFQLAAGLALLLLWQPAVPSWWTRRGVLGAAALVGAGALGLGVWLAHDYGRVNLLYRPAVERPPSRQGDTPAVVARENRFFREPALFAWVTTTPVTQGNAAQIYPAAQRLLHYSPEPRVIEAVLDSARWLGLEAEVALQRERYRAAYPEDYARWVQRSGPLFPTASPQNRATSAM